MKHSPGLFLIFVALAVAAVAVLLSRNLAAGLGASYLDALTLGHVLLFYEPGSGSDDGTVQTRYVLVVCAIAFFAGVYLRAVERR